MNEAKIDLYLDAVLKASGSALKNYSMAKTKDEMRRVMRLFADAVLAECEKDCAANFSFGEMMIEAGKAEGQK